MRTDLIRVVSLTVLLICAVTIAVTGLAGIPMPDVLVRVLGTVTLVSLAVFVFTSVRKATKRR